MDISALGFIGKFIAWILGRKDKEEKLLEERLNLACDDLKKPEEHFRKKGLCTFQELINLNGSISQKAFKILLTFLKDELAINKEEPLLQDQFLSNRVIKKKPDGMYDFHLEYPHEDKHSVVNRLQHIQIKYLPSIGLSETLNYIGKIRNKFPDVTIDLSNTNISLCDLSRGDWSNTDFSGAILRDVSFNNSVLNKSKFVSSILIDSYFENTNCEDCDFSAAIAHRILFDKATIKSCIFRCTDLYDASFQNTKVFDCTFSHNDLWRGSTGLSDFLGSTIDFPINLTGNEFNLAQNIHLNY